MAALSTCYAPMCGFSMSGAERKCPRCGGRMMSSSSIRALGLVMLLCGLFITGLMGAITLTMAPALLGVGKEAAGVRFDGDVEQAGWILNFFWAVIAFGLAATAAGAYQAITARRNRYVVVGVLALAGFLFIFAQLIPMLLG